jgi:hypothetical protein
MWVSLEGFQSPEVKEKKKKSKNSQISIFGFQCVAKNIKEWLKVFHFINTVYSQIFLNRMIATFFNIFPMDGSPLWLTNKSSLKNALGPPDLTRPRLRVSVSQATAVKQVASTAVFQAWGKRLHGLFFYFIEPAFPRKVATVYGILGTRADPGNASCEHMCFRARNRAFDSVVAYWQTWTKKSEEKCMVMNQLYFCLPKNKANTRV